MCVKYPLISVFSIFFLAHFANRSSKNQLSYFWNSFTKKCLFGGDIFDYNSRMLFKLARFPFTYGLYNKIVWDFDGGMTRGQYFFFSSSIILFFFFFHLWVCFFLCVVYVCIIFSFFRFSNNKNDFALSKFIHSWIE